MRYFIIAGEQSGDLHGSNLVRGLLEADSNAEISCWGGDLMESAGATLLVHYRKMAFMGFIAVIKNLGAITKNLSLCKQHITEYKPDVIIFIDYPGFNLRIAEFAKKAGFKTFYYISPKLWAWNENRVYKIKKYVDRMYIIFPFEVDFYKKHNIIVEYLGNPLVDET
ncbi:MAG: lipid-A-disaccharide synthase, partial [Bacteroidia bacterium]|nr:lipid-A-disaccharide synthase [Bacteroidia bacterium]